MLQIQFVIFLGFGFGMKAASGGKSLGKPILFRLFMLVNITDVVMRFGAHK
jgi:hypothetical protein